MFRTFVAETDLKANYYLIFLQAQKREQQMHAKPYSTKSLSGAIANSRYVNSFMKRFLNVVITTVTAYTRFLIAIHFAF